MSEDQKNRQRLEERLTYASPEHPLPKRIFIRSIEKLTGQRKLANVYDTVLQRIPETESHAIWPAALNELAITVDYDAAQLRKVPTDGPLVLIANHPYGVLDGLIICHLAAQLRTNFKILIHRALCIEERIERYLLPVDFTESAEAIQSNIETKQRALATLNAGNAVIIFPAGGISTTVNGPFGPAVDLEWKLFVTKLIQRTEATVVPIYFHGQNSRIFQLASQLSDTLRLALIVHEVTRKRGDTIQVKIGDPIAYDALAGIRKRKELLHHLRNVIYGLSPTAVAHHKTPLLPSERRAARRQKILLKGDRVRRLLTLGERH